MVGNGVVAVEGAGVAGIGRQGWHGGHEEARWAEHEELTVHLILL
jgi:hypothetical protein